MTLTKADVVEAVVRGGWKIHGQTPDGWLLCGSLGDHGSAPHGRHDPHDPRRL